MIGWLVWGGIGVLIILFMSSSLVIRVSLTDRVRIQVGTWGFYRDWRFLEQHKPYKKKKKEADQRKQKIKKQEKQPLKSFPQTVHLVLELIGRIFSPTTFVLRHIRLIDLKIQIAVGSKQPDHTGLLFVGISSGIHQTIALLQNNLVVKVRWVDIKPDFSSEQIKQNVSFRMKLRWGIIIAGIVGILYHIIKWMIQKMMLKKKRKQHPLSHKISPKPIDSTGSR